MNDEEFKVGLSLLAGLETPATQALWKQGALPTFAHNRRLHREFLKRFVKVEVRTEAGIYLGTEDAVLVPKAGIHAVLVRTIRGLYFHHFGEALGARALCDVQRYEGRGADSPELERIVMNLPSNSIAGGAVRYRYGRASDGPLSSIWFLIFFNAVPVFGYTEAAEDKGKSDATR